MNILVLVHQQMIPPEFISKKDLSWSEFKTEYTVIQCLKELCHSVQVVGLLDELQPLENAINSQKIDLVFNLLEEFNYNPEYDQNIVSYLELKGVPYTGCDSKTLMLCRDKRISKLRLQEMGLVTPRYKVFTEVITSENELIGELKFPLIVKSLTEEASLGLSQKSIVHNISQLIERVSFVVNNIRTPALVEEFIKGREVYVGALAPNRVFTPWELNFNDLLKNNYGIATRSVKFNEAYNKKFKITKGIAKLDAMLEKRLIKQCKKILKELVPQGYVRMDLRITDSGELYFIEMNANPELAKGEDFANGAQESGLQFVDLIYKIIRSAMKSHKLKVAS